MTTQWEHFKTVLDGETCHIGGQNIWDVPWHRLNEIADVLDPIYKQPQRLAVYNTPSDLKFAAGEYSNNVWGFYLPKE